MTPNRHGSARIEFPNELEILITREFDAPIALVFDVLTKTEYVSRWGATPPDQMKECSIDLRVGGNYHYSFVTEDGTVCSFDGTYLEVDPPFRTVETWLFDGWPDAEAVRDRVLDLELRLLRQDLGLHLPAGPVSPYGPRRRGRCRRQPR